VPLQVELGSPEASALSFQAVDAGSGAALNDGEMTVRYLVRSPIMLDASAVETVSSREPYRVAHEIAEPNLVLEVRLEAASYHRLDTVLSVPRGGSGGPFTLRMARKLGGEAVAAPASNRPAAGGPRPATQPVQPAAQPAVAAAAIDRSALLAGNQAFGRGDWLAATQAYEQMPEPGDRASAYSDEYKQALVQRGIAHINRGEMGGALDALEAALGFDKPGYQAYLRAGQAQCAVGRTDEGRGTLAILSREVNQMPPAQRPMVNALRGYYDGLCSEGEFDRATAAMDRVRAGAAAIKAFEEFRTAGGAVSPATPELQGALDDAATRIAAIRGRIRRQESRTW